MTRSWPRLSRVDKGNGTYTTYAYDLAGDVLSITNYASASGPVNSIDVYTYDALGNVRTDTNQDGDWVYAYDADSELTQAVFTPNATDPDGLTSQNIQYVYDAAGNRVSQTVNGVTTNYAVNDVNQYTSATVVGGATTTYLVRRRRQPDRPDGSQRHDRIRRQRVEST